MYCNKGDIVQFVLTESDLSHNEIPFTFGVCDRNVTYDDATVTIEQAPFTEQKYIGRDFHRFNVISSERGNLRPVILSEYRRQYYKQRPFSTLVRHE